MNERIDNLLAPECANRGELFASWVRDAPFERALHFGAGRDKRDIGERLSEHGDVIALDSDRDGLTDNTTPSKVQGDGQRLPFGDGSFDLVCAKYVFEHLPDPQLALAEIDRVLRPGGSVILLVPNPRHYFARIAGLTPFWFHSLWFRLLGESTHERDKFPTYYRWGRYAEINRCEYDWSVKRLESFPGPTGYTSILPFHVCFVIWDRLTVHDPRYHTGYLVHYSVTE